MHECWHVLRCLWFLFPNFAATRLSRFWLIGSRLYVIEDFDVTETSTEDGSVQQTEPGAVAQQLGADEAEECSRGGEVSGSGQRSQEQPHDGRRPGQRWGRWQQDASLEPSNSHFHLSS